MRGELFSDTFSTGNCFPLFKKSVKGFFVTYGYSLTMKYFFSSHRTTTIY